jgi:hypothetical protein
VIVGGGITLERTLTLYGKPGWPAFPLVLARRRERSFVMAAILMGRLAGPADE